MKRTKLFCLFVSVVMLFSLSACSKGDGETKNFSQLKIGDYELLYKDACIMEDYAGNDAVVLTLDFTNNSKRDAAYIGSIIEFPVQNKKGLELAAVYVSEESDEMMGDKNASLTIDPTTLSRESGQSGTSALTGMVRKKTPAANSYATGGTAIGMAGGTCTAAGALMKIWEVHGGMSAAPLISARTAPEQ